MSAPAARRRPERANRDSGQVAGPIVPGAAAAVNAYAAADCAVAQSPAARVAYACCKCDPALPSLRRRRRLPLAAGLDRWSSDSAPGPAASGTPSARVIRRARARAARSCTASRIVARSDDRLIAVASPAAAAAELHTMAMDGNVMRMRALRTIDVPAGGQVALQPGGLHVMLLDLKQPLAVGETMPAHPDVRARRHDRGHRQRRVDGACRRCGASALTRPHGMATLASGRTAAPAPLRNGARESGARAGRRLAVRLLRAGVRDGRRRRRDPPHALRPVDHRVAADRRHAAAARTTRDWQAAFAKYRATPEYLQVNRGMTLAEFKGIFWWEYFHRLLGRLIGVAFLVPYLWFLARRRIPAGYALPARFDLRAGRRCRARSAGTWCKAGSSTIRACRSSGSPRISGSRSSSSARCSGSRCRCCRARTVRRAPRRRRAACAGSPSSDGARVRSGADRRLRRGHSRRIRVQHVPADERQRRAARDPHARAPWWKNFFCNMATVQFDHRAHRVGARVHRAVAVVARARDAGHAAARRGRGATCCSRCSACRSRSASRRSC